MNCNHDPLLGALWKLAENARWFSGRSRGGVPRQVELTDWFRPPGEAGPGLRSALLEVAYPTGETERYHVPLAFHAAGDCPTEPLARIELEGTGFDVAEVADEKDVSDILKPFPSLLFPLILLHT